MRVHQLPKGQSIAPMPPLNKEHEFSRKVQGGLPPEPYRSTSHKWVRCMGFARDHEKRIYTKFKEMNT
jgi:hypothetical protein